MLRQRACSARTTRRVSLLPNNRHHASMRNTRLLLCVAVLTTVLHPPAVQAQVLPACPANSDDDKLSPYVPSYSRHGQSDRFRVELVVGTATDISNVTLTITPTNTPPTTVPVVLDENGNAELVLVAPTQGQSYRAVYEWDQDVGTQAGCHASDGFEVPLIPTIGRAGDPERPRFAGSFRVRYRNADTRGRKDRSIWRITPSCAYFACSANLRSTGGLRGVLTLLSNGSYRITKKGRSPEDCVVTTSTVNRLTGEMLSRRTRVIKNAFRYTSTFTLNVVADSTMRVVRFTGSNKFVTAPTAAARAKGCTKSFTTYDRLGGVRFP